MATTTINFRTDVETKKEAARVCKALGTDISHALNLFLHQIALRKSIPLDVSLPHIPNAETLEAFAEIEATRGQGGMPVDEFLKEMHSWK